MHRFNSGVVKKLGVGWFGGFGVAESRRDGHSPLERHSLESCSVPSFPLSNQRYTFCPTEYQKENKGASKI